MKLQKLILIKVLMLLSGEIFAQKYSLQQCIETAISNNLKVQQSSVDMKISEASLQQIHDNRLPVVNASTGQGMSFGRGVDPYTNTSINQQIGYNNVGISSSLVLFNGWQQVNSIKQQEYQILAEKTNLKAIKENVTLNVILAYLQVLSNKELLVVANSQASVTKQQIEKTEKLIRAGVLAETNLIDLKVQLTNDELGIVNAKNNLSGANLTLLQWINLSPNEPIEVEPLTLNEINLFAPTAEEVYNQAKEKQSFLKVNEYRVLAANKAIEVIKGTRYPVVSFNLGLSTNYSSAAKRNVISEESTEMNTGLYVPVSGVNLPVMAIQPKSSVENISYFNQIELNRNLTFNLQVRIPILNGYSYRNKLNIANLNRENLLFTDKINRQQLRQNIEQAYNNMTMAFERYGSITKQVSVSQEAFSIAEIKFNSGTMNSLDYNITKSNFDKAKINLIQAKYDYLLRMRVLEFYQDRP